MDPLEFVPADAFTKQFSDIYKVESPRQIEVGDRVSIEFIVVDCIDGVCQIITDEGRGWFFRPATEPHKVVGRQPLYRCVGPRVVGGSV